jgi:hypothetical protein
MEKTNSTWFPQEVVNDIFVRLSPNDYANSDLMRDRNGGNPEIANKYLDRITGLETASNYLSLAEIESIKNKIKEEHMALLVENGQYDNTHQAQIIPLEDRPKITTSTKGKTPKIIKHKPGSRPSQIYLRSIR